MERNIESVLNGYCMLTYYDEIRDDEGRLIFCNGHSFNKVNVDDITNYILLSNDDDPGNMCMLNPSLDFEIIPIKFAMDKIIFRSGKGKIIFFAKKYENV